MSFCSRAGLPARLFASRGELRVVQIPSEQAEARRLLARERGLLQKEVGQHRDRARKLLLLHGCMPHGLILCYERGRTTVYGMDSVKLIPLKLYRVLY